METSFSISDRTSQEVPEIVVADLSGDLDTEAAYELESSLSDIVSQDGVKVVLNFSNIRIMNSTAMGVLLSAAEEARKRGGIMKLCSLSDHVREVLDLVGVSSLFEIFPSEAEAVSSFN
ncbi:STAS domain-containing protein [Planctomycetota bacterium]